MQGKVRGIALAFLFLLAFTAVSVGQTTAVANLQAYNPHQLGLKCDGSDEGAAIQTALNTVNAKGGGIIQMQAGDNCNAGSTVLWWPTVLPNPTINVVIWQGTGYDYNGMWGTPTMASSSLTLGCTNPYGCIKFESVIQAGISNLALRNSTTCAPFIYDTNTTLTLDASFKGSAGRYDNTAACNDAVVLSEPIVDCLHGSGDDTCFGGFGSSFIIYTDRIRRAAVLGSWSAETTWWIYGNSTDSNSSADAILMSGMCNDNVTNTCGFPSLTCSGPPNADTVTLTLPTPSGGTAATATVKCTSNDHIANGTAITITYPGTGYTMAPTMATGSCTPPCAVSGMAHLNTVILGPFVDVLGYANSAAIKNTFYYVYTEMGNAADMSHSGSSHYNSAIRYDYANGNQALAVTGDDSGSSPAPTALIVATANAQGNRSTCQFYIAYDGGSHNQFPCFSDPTHGPNGDYGNTYLDLEQSKDYTRTYYGAHLGDGNNPFSDATWGPYSVAAPPTGATYKTAWFSNSDGTCSTTTGSVKVWCFFDGMNWVPMGNGSSPTFTAPALGNATAASVLSSGTVDGTMPLTIASGSTTLGATYKSGYTLNQGASPAITYTLPLGTLSLGQQYCVANSNNGSTASTSQLTLRANTGQKIVFTDGTLTTVGGGIQNATLTAAGNEICVVSIGTALWQVTGTPRGNWTKVP